MNTSPAAISYSAGEVAPSKLRYRVVEAHDHKTLQVGDIVVMLETPKFDNVLLRKVDMTLHVLTDANDQYVRLSPIP